MLGHCLLFFKLGLTQHFYFFAEADAEFMEAEALYGYTARTHKELSFRKGDVILVFSRTNADWWDAQLNGQNGFVPATYVKLLSPEHERFDSIGSSSGIVTRPNLKEEIAFEPQLKSEGKSSSDEGKGTTKPAFERTISVESSSELQQANVFASIDPTSDNRKPVSRESSFKKTYTLPQRGGPGQLNAAGPQPFRLSQHLPKTESQDSFASDSLSSTLTAVREAFSGPRGQRVAAVKPMQISNKELMETQSKLRPGTPEDMPQKRESPEMQRPNLSPRGSVKDMTKLFGVPRKSLKGDEFDSPTGSTTRRSSSGSTDLDNHSRSSSVSSEKDASGRPAPAVLPKPKRRDGPGQGGSSELIATIHAAAVAKVVKETKEEGGT